MVLSLASLPLTAEDCRDYNKAIELIEGLQNQLKLATEEQEAATIHLQSLLQVAQKATAERDVLAELKASTQAEFDRATQEASYPNSHTLSPVANPSMYSWF